MSFSITQSHGRKGVAIGETDHRWINLAASQTSNDEGESIRRLRDLLAKEMTREQIAEAQESAREWESR